MFFCEFIWKSGCCIICNALLDLILLGLMFKQYSFTLREKKSV